MGTTKSKCYFPVISGRIIHEGKQMSQMPNLDLNKFGSKCMPGFVPAFIRELARAAGKMCNTCGGTQSGRMYALGMSQTLGHSGVSHGQFILCSHGENEMVSHPS